MTATIHLADIVTSIHGLTISGVQMLGTDKIPENAKMNLPVFMPRPKDFITNFRPLRLTFGSMGTQSTDLTYTLNYVYLHAPLGSGVGGLFSVYDAMVTKIVLIQQTILNNDIIGNAADVTIENISAIGPIEDAAGNVYHGCEMAIKVLEHLG